MSICRSCGAEIVWAETIRGRRIPLDAKPVGPLFETVTHSDGRVLASTVGAKLRLSHFATCPNADEHRRA